MSLELLLITCLATYRITLLVHKEAGPSDIFGRFRTWAGVTYDAYSNPISNGELSAAILCPFCLSIWIGILVTLYLGLAVYFGVVHIAVYLLLPFAMSGAASYLFKLAGV